MKIEYNKKGSKLVLTPNRVEVKALERICKSISTEMGERFQLTSDYVSYNDICSLPVEITLYISPNTRIIRTRNII